MTLPGDYVDRHVELGWAVTGYGNQGDTVDIGLAVLEPGTTRNHAYVALTRGRHNNSAWIPDPTGTLDPADALTAMIERAPHGDSALAVRRQLHRAAGRVEPDLATTAAIDDRVAEPTVPPEPDAPSQAQRVAEMQRRFDRLQAASGGLDRGIQR